MKRIRRISILALTVIFVLMNAVPAFAAGAVYSQIDSSAIPYKTTPNTYLITQTGVLTWKKYNTVLGFNDMGTQKTAEPITEVYENRQGDTPEGTLNYSWTFDGTVLSPITENKKGPINLGITLTQTDDGVKAAFATTRVFDGKVNVTLNVGSYYKDGDKLNLSYVDGVDASQIHGTDTSVTGVDPVKEDGLTVLEGLVTFTITNGGNYTLIRAKAEETKEKDTKTDTDSKGADIGTDVKEVTVFDDTKTSDKDIKTEMATDQGTSKAKEKTVTKAPKTGSEDNIMLYGVAILLTGTGILICRRKNILR